MKEQRSPHGFRSRPVRLPDALKLPSCIPQTPLSVPFLPEYAKTQLQLQSRGATFTAVPDRRFTGPVDVITTTIRKRGPRGIYRGASVLIVGNIPKAGDTELKGWRSAICGGGAGIVEAALVSAPKETIKTKFINDKNLPKSHYNGLMRGIRTIFREEGWRGIYQGVAETTARQALNGATRFGFYSTTSSYLPESIQKTFLGSFLAGLVAGTASTYITMPVDVVKTRMQSLDAKRYKSGIDCAQRVFMEEGWRTFWTGSIPRLSRAMFSTAIVFSVQGEIADWLVKVTSGDGDTQD